MLRRQQRYGLASGVHMVDPYAAQRGYVQAMERVWFAELNRR